MVVTSAHLSEAAGRPVRYLAGAVEVADTEAIAPDRSGTGQGYPSPVSLDR